MKLRFIERLYTSAVLDTSALNQFVDLSRVPFSGGASPMRTSSRPASPQSNDVKVNKLSYVIHCAYEMNRHQCVNRKTLY